jgi:hypothetical protein
MLRPAQHWREPAAHCAGSATEVVDHPAAGYRERSREGFDEIARPGRGVSWLA